MNLLITPKKTSQNRINSQYTSISSQTGNCHTNMIIDLENLFLMAGEFGL